MSAPLPRIGVVTISDRASQGVYEDQSGPAIEAALRDYLATECRFDARVIADERARIGETIRELAAQGCCLICTTGGTGPSPRDVTPEAVSGKATVASFTVNHVPWVPNLPVPYVFAAVELEEQPGLRLSTEIVNIDPEAVSIGMAVQVVFKQQEEIYLPLFEPQER